MTPNIDIATGWMPQIVHMCILATVALSFEKQMVRRNNKRKLIWSTSKHE
jgi:hypothetical protein